MKPGRSVALTMGDPAGIGGEIAFGAWRSRRVSRPFFLIDDPERLRRLSRDVPVEPIGEASDAAAVFDQALPVLPLGGAVQARPGKPERNHAEWVLASIRAGVELAMNGQAAALVTNPINKKALYDGAGFAFPGHTEYLGHLANVPRTVMLLAGPSLKVVPVTIHIPLRDVPAALSRSQIVETARLSHAALARDFGIDRPRLAVCGLNPHAGEGGAMGREEIETIAPAIEELRAEGIDVTGPHPADTLFHAAARKRYDVALAMYHDQGLIPLKALDFDRGVNVTLGLPFVRTSPDHGTAYDIAGTGRADPTSLIEALNLAAQMAERREATTVPG